uniref:Uncharacterized protein n=1 Tax=Peronospora matthiolae TaxID=2874970 RepID=A0AAV1UAH2_9STRA
MSLTRQYKKRPSAVDLKQQRMAQEDKLRYDEPVEVSGSDHDVPRWNKGAPSFENREPRCALCCDYETAYEASFSDVLFLCPSCNQKYPTQ